MGINFTPLFSWPLIIKPNTSEPNIEEVIKLKMEKNIIKEEDTPNLEKVIGNDELCGISTLAKLSCKTVIKNEDRPNSIGAPTPIAKKIKIAYIKTLALIFSSTNLSCLKFDAT